MRACRCHGSGFYLDERCGLRMCDHIKLGLKEVGTAEADDGKIAKVYTDEMACPQRACRCKAGDQLRRDVAARAKKQAKGRKNRRKILAELAGRVRV